MAYPFYLLAAVTVQSQSAVNPLEVSAVILAVPSPTNSTNPFSSTVATAGVSLTQVTVLSVALSGAIVAVSCLVAPTVPVAVF
jgi:hypothetical protein